MERNVVASGAQSGALRRRLIRLTVVVVVLAGGLLLPPLHGRVPSAAACCDNSTTGVSGAPNPATPADSIVVSAHVCDVTPNFPFSMAGSVEFRDVTAGSPGTLLGSGPITAAPPYCGDASLSIGPLAAGTYTIQAIQHGTDEFGDQLNFSSNSYAQTVAIPAGGTITTISGNTAGAAPPLSATMPCIPCSGAGQWMGPAAAGIQAIHNSLVEASEPPGTLENLRIQQSSSEGGTWGYQLYVDRVVNGVSTLLGTGIFCNVSGGNSSCGDFTHAFPLLSGDKVSIGVGNPGNPFTSGGFTVSWSFDLVQSDTTKPTVTLLSQPASLTKLATASFGFNATDPDDAAASLTVQCKLDASVFATCATATSQSYSGLADGTHSFTVHAGDPAGNQSSDVSYSWTVDTTPPTLSGVPADIFKATTSPNGVIVSFTPPSASDQHPGGPVSCQPASGSLFPVGATTVTCSATDAAGNTAGASFKVTVVLETLTPSAASGQYSDQVSLQATVAGLTLNTLSTGGSLQFSLGGNTVGSPVSLPASAVSGGQLVFHLTTTVALAPGQYSIGASFTPGDATDFKPVNGTLAKGLTVTAEDARVSYTGDPTTWSSPTGTTALVFLSTTIKDISAVPADPASDGYPGDIRTATVKFVDRGNANATLCTAPVLLVNAGNQQVGTASCSAAVSLGSQSSLSLTVGTVVGGNYTRDSSADNASVAVSKGRSGASVYAQGSLQSSQVGGALASTSGATTATLMLQAAYTAGAMTPTGSLTLTFNGNGHVYRLLGTGFTALSEGGQNAVVEATGSLLDITNLSSPVLADGNVRLQLRLHAGSGSAGTVALALYRGDGSLALAVRWDGSQPQPQTLLSGLVSVS